MFRFATLILIGILAGAEVDLFIPSFPELQQVFDLSPVMVQLTLSVNFIAYCLSCLFVGALGDRYNRRYVVLISLFLFVVGSICCVFANHFIFLLIGRFLQGIGIAGPAVLSFPILVDEYPLEKQPAMIGMLNGITTFAMAFAPVVGSFIALYFHWRGNFAVLLILGIIALVAGYFAIPHKKGDLSISLSPKAYLPLLRSLKLHALLGVAVFIAGAYWLFVGMAPLLYMEGLGVELKHFGYYQGALCLTFAIVSILSSKLLNHFGQGNCFYFGKWCCLVAGFLILLLAVFKIQNPLTITLVMLVFSVGAVFPINILLPSCFEVIENSKGRAAALFHAYRLLLTGLLLEVVSFFYRNDFYAIGLTLFFLIMGAFFLLRKIIQNKWVALDLNLPARSADHSIL